MGLAAPGDAVQQERLARSRCSIDATMRPGSRLLLPASAAGRDAAAAASAARPGPAGPWAPSSARRGRPSRGGQRGPAAGTAPGSRTATRGSGPRSSAPASTGAARRRRPRPRGPRPAWSGSAGVSPTTLTTTPGQQARLERHQHQVARPDRHVVRHAVGQATGPARATQIERDFGVSHQTPLVWDGAQPRRVDRMSARLASGAATVVRDEPSVA